MIRTLLITISIGSSVIGASRMPPCYCIPPTVSDSLKAARVVFLGEVSEIIEPKFGGENLPQTDRAYTIKFKVQKTWKGLSSDAADFAVLWTTNCYECPELPQLHETYLIYGNPVPDNKTLSFVGWCNRTVLFLHRSDGNDSRLDMKELDVIPNVQLRKDAYHKSLHGSRISELLIDSVRVSQLRAVS